MSVPRTPFLLCVATVTVGIPSVAGRAAADVPAAAPAWTVTTLAGNGRAGFRDGTGTKEGAAEFNGPVGVACDAGGAVYVADDRNHAVRRIGPDGTTTTVAGDGTPGFRDGVGRQALFRDPRALAMGPDGTVYIADTGNNKIRKMTADSHVSTLAGMGRAGFADGPGTRAELDGPTGVAVDLDGVLYVADTGNHRIRRIAADGAVTTLAGNGKGEINDGTGGTSSMASFFFPDAIAMGPNRTLFVRDGRSYESFRIVAPDGTTTTPGGLRHQMVVGLGVDFPVHGVVVDANGNLLLSHDMWIDQMSPGTWMSQPAAGLTAHGFADGAGDRETGTAVFDRVTALARCPDGSIVAADTGNNSIRRLCLSRPAPAGPDPWAGLGVSEPNARSTRTPSPSLAAGLGGPVAHVLAPTLALDRERPVVAWIESTPRKVSAGSPSTPELRSVRVTRWSGTRWIELPPAGRWPEHSAMAEDDGGLVPANGPSLALDRRGQPMIAWISDWHDVRISDVRTSKGFDQRLQQKKGGRWVDISRDDTPNIVASSGEGELHVRQWDERARAWRTLPDPTLLLTEGDASEDRRSVSAFQLASGPGGEPFLAVTLGASIRVVHWRANRWHELVGDDQREAVDGADPGLALAVDSAGQPILAFLGYDGVAHLRRWSGARWDDLPQLPMPEFCKHRDLRLTVDSAGAVLLATTTIKPASDEEHAPLLVFIEVHQLTHQGWVSLGSPSHPILRPSDHYAFHPSLAIDAAGMPMVAWQETMDARMVGLPWENRDPDSSEIYLRRWDGQQWQELSGSATAGGVSNTVSQSEFPAVAVGKSSVCVSWQDRPRHSAPSRPQEPPPQQLLRCHDLAQVARH